MRDDVLNAHGQPLAEVAAALVTAIAHGLVLCRAVEEHTYPQDILGWVVIALLPLLTAAEDDRDDATGTVEHIATDALGAGAS